MDDNKKVSEQIESFVDLHVYKKSFELQQVIFEITKRFPKEEQYSLTDQVRRASRSVGANICEAWQKRRYKAHFLSKLSDADGEQAETQHWLQTAHSCGYVSGKEYEDLTQRYKMIGSMIGKMMNDPEKWCSRFSTK